MERFLRYVGVLLLVLGTAGVIDGLLPPAIQPALIGVGSIVALIGVGLLMLSRG